MDRSTLSAELKAHLVAERRRLPHARILFVRRTGRRRSDGLAAFVAQTGGVVRRLELEQYDELVGVDLALAGAPVEHPLFLVCTHGKHDRCCAKLGRPLYDAVREQVEDNWVWQSSHVGGDRFAGNLVVLPDGVYYGRVEPSEAWPVVEAALERRIHLPCYRGRSCHGFAAQAADLAAREHTGLLGVDDVRVRSIRPEAAGWHAEVEAGAAVYEVEVTVTEGEPTHLTCSTPRLRRPQRYVAGTPRARGA